MSVGSDRSPFTVARPLAGRSRRLGRVTGSSGGYILPNPTGDVRAPDVAFVRAGCLPRPTANYAAVVRDLAFEVASKRDRPDALREQIRQFLELGTQLGVLADLRSRAAEALRPNSRQTLNDSDMLRVPEVLPG